MTGKGSAQRPTDKTAFDKNYEAIFEKKEPECNSHPDAPHGFARDASHSAGRYVCECEGWEPECKHVWQWGGKRMPNWEFCQECKALREIKK